MIGEEMLYAMNSIVDMKVVNRPKGSQTSVELPNKFNFMNQSEKSFSDQTHHVQPHR